MKFATCLLLASVSAVTLKYDESEGPTKADNGEIEEAVVYREADSANGKKESGWTNPLGWSDTGEDDDSVILQLHSNVKYGDDDFVQQQAEIKYLMGQHLRNKGDDEPQPTVAEHLTTWKQYYANRASKWDY